MRKSSIPPLGHILEAIRDVQEISHGRELADIQADRIHWRALERGIEIISEASRRLPEALKDRTPQIPWRDIAGIGNVLRHDYDKISPRLIWKVVRHDLTPLERACEAELLRARAEEGGSP